MVAWMATPSLSALHPAASAQTRSRVATSKRFHASRGYLLRAAARSHGRQEVVCRLHKRGRVTCTAAEQAASAQTSSTSSLKIEDELATFLPFVADSSRLSPEISYSYNGMLKKAGKLNYLALHEHWRTNVPSTLGTDFKYTVRHSLKKDARTVVVRWTASWIAVDADGLRQADQLLTLLNLIDVEPPSSSSGKDLTDGAKASGEASVAVKAEVRQPGTVVTDDQLEALQGKLTSAEVKLSEALLELEADRSFGGWGQPPSVEAPKKAVDSALKLVQEIRGSLQETAKAQAAQAAPAQREQAPAEAGGDRADGGSASGGWASVAASASATPSAAMQEPLLTIEQAKLRQKLTCAVRGQTVITLDADQRIVGHEDTVDWTWGEGIVDAGMGKAASEASADPESGFKPSDTVWVWCCAFRPPDVSAFLWQMSVARQLLWESYVNDSKGGFGDEPVLSREEFDTVFNTAVTYFALQIAFVVGFMIYFPYWFLVVAPTIPAQFDEAMFRAGLTDAPMYDSLGTTAAAAAAAATSAVASSSSSGGADAAAAAAAAAAASAKSAAALTAAGAAGAAVTSAASTGITSSALFGQGASYALDGSVYAPVWLIILQSWLEKLPP